MAVALRLLEPITDETLLALSRANPERRFETTADGQLIVSLFTGTLYSFGEAELFAQVQNWNRERKLGRVIPASGGVRLPDGAVKGPDTAYVSNELWDSLSTEDKTRAFVRVAPTVVFELLSPNDDYDELLEKVDEYLRTGSAAAVLLDPRDRSVRLYRILGSEPQVYDDAMPIVIGPEMPGFRMDARAVFDACEGH